jgi:hypothetical protein
MPGPGLIEDYRAVLSAQLPASIAEELADGLAETYRSYLDQGLAPDAAAGAAVAEFGELPWWWPPSPAPAQPGAPRAGC